MVKEKVTSRQFYSNIVKQHKDEYVKLGKLGKGILLDNLESVVPFDRKSIIRILNQKSPSYSSEALRVTHIQESIPGARGRPVIYTPEVNAALEYVWQAYNQPCAERLYPEISRAIEIFRRDQEWLFSDRTTELLLKMSLGTMRIRLGDITRKHHSLHGISTTKKSPLLNLIPTFHGDWSSKPVGYGQIDTVVHSGGKLLAPMVYTVNFIDMQTYWQEMVAQLGKTDDATLASLKLIEQRLPFPLVGLHPDSGDEFLNWLVYHWCRQKELHFTGDLDGRRYDGKIEITRSRPNKKNDNCNIEERNGAIIRKYIGYERYDCNEAVRAMNELYTVLRLYVNYFQPIQKLIGKEKQKNGKYKRVYDKARTPFARVMERPDISVETKAKLVAEYEVLNPRHLLAKIKALTIKLKRVQQDQGYHG